MKLAWWLALVLLTPLVRVEDLAKRYPGTLTWVEQGLGWRCGPEDVWRLKSFALEFGKDFELRTGPADVALGVHEGNVLWAVVFPEQPGKIRAKGQPGDGEAARTILLRFAPAELARVFPAKTVVGPGDPWLRARAERIFRAKIGGQRWSTPAGNPTIVQPGFTLVDVEGPAPVATGAAKASGKRRFYELDGSAGKLTYGARFEAQTLAPEEPIGAQEAARVFDEVWSAFDREYANFVSLPKLDWKKLGAERKQDLARVHTSYELAAVLGDLLAQLQDLHVWVKCGDDWLPGWSPERPLNASWKGSETLVGGFTDSQHDLVWARTKDGLGYLNVHALGDAELPPAFDAALDALADTWGLVLDLRFDGGGDELLAQALAGRFLDQERVYSKNQYRSGAAHDALGEVLERTCAPRGPWRYQAPVVVLQGQRTMSSAESFALMLAQCPQVTTMGERTAGSSANPRRLEPGAGITVNLPRWRDMDPDGNPIEHVGVPPRVKLGFAANEYSDARDPLLAAALERLRQLPKAERKAGRR